LQLINYISLMEIVSLPVLSRSRLITTNLFDFIHDFECQTNNNDVVKSTRHEVRYETGITVAQSFKVWMTK
jgi:hypothetical protein